MVLKSSSAPEPDTSPGLGAPLHPGAAHATESTTAATELGDNQDKSYLKSFNKEEISYLDEQQIFGHS